MTEIIAKNVNKKLCFLLQFHEIFSWNVTMANIMWSLSSLCKMLRYLLWNCVKSIWHITTSVFNLSVRMWKINLSKIVLIDSICVWFSGSTMFHFGWLKRFSNHRWAVTVRKSWIILSMWPKNVTIWTIYIQNMPSFQPYKAPQFFDSRKLGIYWVNGTKMYLTNCMNYSVKNPISRNYGSI